MVRSPLLSLFVRSSLITATLVGALSCRLMGAGEERGADEIMKAAWESAATFFPNESLLGFGELGGGLEEGPREARFGYAVALLSANPATREQLDLAESIFLSLAESGDDELGLGSRFLLGRIHQIYRSPMEPEEAARHFQLLIDEHPESRWAQMSLVKLGLLIVYSLPDAGAPAERLAAAGELLAKATGRDARRDLHLLMASAHFHYKLEDTGALPHLVAAEEEGVLDIGSRADVLVRIGELYVLAGQPGNAVPYYRRFVSEYYGDQRRYAVQKKIEAITGEEETD
ncbi:MAG: tetratricopeptide repeat protein [Opitutaceae bacterium]